VLVVEVIVGVTATVVVTTIVVDEASIVIVAVETTVTTAEGSSAHPTPEQTYPGIQQPPPNVSEQAV